MLATLVYIAVCGASAATAFAAVLVEIFLLNPIILACLTFGIGFLWLTPYMELSSCEFYEDLKAEQAGKPLEGTIS